MTTVKPKKSGNEPINQQRCDNQAPHRHRHRIVRDDPDRCQDRDCRTDVAIEQQRERHHADGQHQNCEQKADAIADNDECPSGGRREHLVEERRDDAGGA